MNEEERRRLDSCIKNFPHIEGVLSSNFHRLNKGGYTHCIEIVLRDDEAIHRLDKSVLFAELKLLMDPWVENPFVTFDNDVNEDFLQERPKMSLRPSQTPWLGGFC